MDKIDLMLAAFVAVTAGALGFCFGMQYVSDYCESAQCPIGYVGRQTIISDKTWCDCIQVFTLTQGVK